MIPPTDKNPGEFRKIRCSNTFGPVILNLAWFSCMIAVYWLSEYSPGTHRTSPALKAGTSDPEVMHDPV